MKKLLALLIVTVLVFACVVSASAAGITAEEQSLIDAFAQKITMKSGTVVALPDKYINQAKDYLTKADLTTEQINEIKANIDTAVVAVKDSDAKSMSSASDSVKQTVISEAKAAAEVVNAVLNVEKKTTTGENGTVVANYNAKLVFDSNSTVPGYTAGQSFEISTTEKEIVQTGAEGNVTATVVVSVLVLVAVAFVIVSSSKKAYSK